MTSVYAALAAVMADVDHVAKRDINRDQRYVFRGIDAVVNAVGPALRRHGVIVIPQVVDVAYEAVQTSTGKPSTACRVKVAYIFWGPEGDYIETSVIGEAWDWGDKSAPKAMSVAFRTALLQVLALPTDEPDPDSQSYERAEPRVYPEGGIVPRPPVDSGAPPLAEAKARAWNVGRRLWPDAKPDELKRETEGALMGLGSSIANADTETWVKLAEQWEAQYDHRPAHREGE